MFIFTIFHCFTVFSNLKKEVETNFDLTDNMLTGTESVFRTCSQNCRCGTAACLENPFTRNGIYMVTFQTTLKF